MRLLVKARHNIQRGPTLCAMTSALPLIVLVNSGSNRACRTPRHDVHCSRGATS
jgi:hypothetical protein